MNKYDVIVIGSGPGGYVAAIRCAQLGIKTAIVEKYDTLGGTCLNVGCIPSKALLDSSEHFHNAQHNFSYHGIKINPPKVDFNQMIKRKNEVVSQTCNGVSYLMKKNKIDVFMGHAQLLSNTAVQITSKKDKQKIEGEKIIIATGSKPATIPNVKVDKERIITSTEALNLKEIPKSMLIIGGGVIGLELGSVYARLGTKITVIEYMDRIISTMDSSLSKELKKVLEKLNFEFYLNHKVQNVTKKGNGVILEALNSSDEKVSFNAEYCLVSVGRKPNTYNLGLENTAVELDERGRIKVNNSLRTTSPNIYAIGDVVKGPMLAHKAEEEGVFVAELIANQQPHINYNLIPGVVYTWPEVASVGKTEDELKEVGIPYKIGSFPFKASGRARASMDIDGFVKVIADKNSDEILGVHIVGPRAADMISEAVVAMEYRASAEDIARICHAHPTFTEAIKEACLSASENRPLHL